MKIYRTLKYKIKNLIPMAAIAGATLTSCGGGSNGGKIEPETPTKEIEIKFTNSNRNDVLDMTKLQNYANDKTIKTIYLVPMEHWNAYYASHITTMRNQYFQPRLNISPKIKGRGNFDFVLGEASKVPQDSLWYVKQGWTINKR